METQRGVSRRIDQLEERAEALHVRRVAARIGAEIGCPPDELIAEAERLADLVDLHGLERTIEIVAERVGLTPEELERGAERFKAMLS
jgi:hypothetical protein